MIGGSAKQTLPPCVYLTCHLSWYLTFCQFQFYVIFVKSWSETSWEYRHCKVSSRQELWNPYKEGSYWKIGKCAKITWLLWLYFSSGHRHWWHLSLLHLCLGLHLGLLHLCHLHCLSSSLPFPPLPLLTLLPLPSTFSVKTFGIRSEKINFPYC